jgi:hypothetical protein
MGYATNVLDVPFSFDDSIVQNGFILYPEA